MLSSLSRRLAAFLLLLFLLVGGIFVVAILVTTRLHNEEVTQRFNRSLADHLVSDRVLMRDGKVDEAAVEEIFHMLMVVNPAIELYLLDGEGTILTFSAPPGKVRRSRVSLEPLKRFLAGSDGYPIRGDDPRDLERGKIFSVAEIPGPDGIAGYLYVILGGEAYESAAQVLEGSYIIRLSLMMVAGGLFFALLAGLLFFQHLTRRLRRLTADMERFRRSGFADRPPPLPRSFLPGEDEIDRLGVVYGHMAERIQVQLRAIREADERRREMVSSVSHDLRTPLASLQGYLETLVMKIGDLSPEERDDYLKTAVENARELERRVEELLEIARLDSPDLRPNREDFPLDELVEAVVQRFRVAAERKGLRIETRSPEGLPFVSADIELVKRVLENLVENSLRSSNEGGRVTVALREGSDGVELEVADEGSGIRPEDLPRIFERHFKGAGGGSGLGLAISQKIVELHGGSIRVASRVGEGSTFTFSLPAAGPSPPSGP